MPNWAGGVLTAKGRALQAKVEAGQTLELTKMKLGSGTPEPEEIDNLTDLKQPQNIMGISSKTVENNVCEVTSVILTSNINTPFYAREWGLFANDPDEGEILYMYTTDPNPDYIPDKNSALVISASYALNIAVLNVDNIVANIDPEGLITAGILEEELKKYLPLSGGEMTGDITANNIYANNNILVFNNVAEMKASNKIKAGYTLKTLSFYTAGDGGGADYVIVNSIGEDEVDEYSVIALQKGLYAKILVQDYLNVKQLGVKSDGKTDNTELIQNILNKFNKIYFPSGSYLITKTLKVKEGTQILGTRKSFIPNASYVNAQPRGISSESQFICAITDIENSSIFNCDKLVTIKGLDIYYPNQNYNPSSLEDIVAYKPTILLNSYGCTVENIYVCGANSFLYASNATQTIVKNIFGFAFSKAFTFINGRDTVYFSNIQFNITANVMSVDVVNRLIFNNTFLEMIDCDGIITNNIGCILFNNVFVFTYNKHTTRANTLLINNVFIDTSGNIFTVTTGVASPNLIKANNIVAVGGYAEDGGCFLRFNVTEPSSLYRIAQFNNVGYSVGSTITTLKVPTYYIKILNSSDTPNTKYHNLYLMFNNCSFEPTAEMTNQGEKIPFIYNQATNDFIKLTGTIFKDGEIIDTQTLQINAEQETIDTQVGE